MIDETRNQVLGFGARGLEQVILGDGGARFSQTLSERLAPPTLPGWQGVFSSEWFQGRPITREDLQRKRRPGDRVEIDLQLREPAWNPERLQEVVRRECIQERAGAAPGVHVVLRDPEGTPLVEADWYPEGSSIRRVADPDAADGVAIRWI